MTFLQLNGGCCFKNIVPPFLRLRLRSRGALGSGKVPRSNARGYSDHVGSMTALVNGSMRQLPLGVTRFHSAFIFCMLLRRNCRNPRQCLICPNGGSASALRRAYSARPFFVRRLRAIFSFTLLVTHRTNSSCSACNKTYDWGGFIALPPPPAAPRLGKYSIAIGRPAEMNLPVRRTSSPSHGTTRRTGSPSYKLRMVSSILPVALQPHSTSP